MIPISATLDTVWPMARDVVDLAIVLDATVGHDPADPSTVEVAPTSYVDAVDPNGLVGRRIGLVSPDLSANQERLITRATNELEANGADMVDVTLPRVPNIEPLFFEIESALDSWPASRTLDPVARRPDRDAHPDPEGDGSAAARRGARLCLVLPPS